MDTASVQHESNATVYINNLHLHNLTCMLAAIAMPGSSSNVYTDACAILSTFLQHSCLTKCCCCIHQTVLHSCSTFLFYMYMYFYFCCFTHVFYTCLSYKTVSHPLLIHYCFTAAALHSCFTATVLHETVAQLQFTVLF